MLVLTRKIDQAILIRTPIGTLRIVLLGVDGNRRRAQIGFDGPAEFVVIREEIEQR